MRAFCRPERRYRTIGIARVTLTQILQKVGHISRKTLANQLLISPVRARLNACSQEYFQRGLRKNNGAHVAPVCHQPRCFQKAMLQVHQCVPHSWQSGDSGSGIADCFDPYCVTDVFAGQQDLIVIETHIKTCCQCRDGRFIRLVNASLMSRKRGQAV